jgi:type VI secretion system protein ImpC
MAEEKTEQQAAATTTDASSLLGDIASATTNLLEKTRLPGGDERHSETARGMSAIIQEVMKSTAEVPSFNVETIDQMIADIDAKLSAQVDEILHDPKYQELESTWRGLKFLIDRTNFDEMNKVEFLSVSKQELEDDFESAPTLRSSRLCRLVFEEEYGTFGGEPIGAMIGNYTFNPSTPDMALLRRIANVASQAHAPFIAAAGPQFFGMESFEGLPTRNSVKTSAHKKWQSFRESENANYVGLTMPRFMLRLPYDPVENPARSFLYQEQVTDNHEKYLWGNASFAFATRLTESFAKYRWCPNIIGPRAGGAVEDLPLHSYEALGALETKPPTEISLSETRELELSKEGFIPLVFRKGSDNACFFSANSTQQPKFFGNSAAGKAAETNFKLGTQLPYLFLVTRLAHHIKVFQREELGSSKSRESLESELNDWIKQYVSAQNNPPAAVMAKRPFREVALTVEEIPGEPGWYSVKMRLRPHLKYMGAYFDLSLVGSLETTGG